jgi:hypothetical protein
VGGTGVVAVLKNGQGPTVLLRTDMDALPIEEKTSLAYASHVVVKSDSGTPIPVMHACGHDIHMSSWVGTAKLMATNRDRWHGTLILIGQPNSWQHRLKREHPTCTERKSLTKSADGRVATVVATRRRKKSCPTKKQQNPLDSDRPSHGRFITSELRPLVLPLGPSVQ